MSSVRLSIWLSVCPSLFNPSVCVCVPVCVPVRPAACPSVLPSVHLSVSLYAGLSVCLSACLTDRLSVCLSVRLPVYLHACDTTPITAHLLPVACLRACVRALMHRIIRQVVDVKYTRGGHKTRTANRKRIWHLATDIQPTHTRTHTPSHTHTHTHTHTTPRISCTLLSCVDLSICTTS